MSIFAYLIIFLGLIHFSFSFTPIWKLSKSSINLLDNIDEITITIYDQMKISQVDNNNYIHAVLEKKLKRKGSQISEQNTISILNNEITQDTDWEDIENIFFIDNVGHFICPKGKYFLNQYDNSKFKEIKPTNFVSSDDWELICYQQFNGINFMFTGFLNEKRSDNNYKFYGYNLNLKNWESQSFQFLDFIWSTDVEYIGDNKIFQMKALRVSNSKIYFQHLIVTVDYQNKIFIDDSVSREEIASKSIYSYAYFNHDTKLFYWMSCNTISDFKSGYSTNPINNVKDKNFQSGKVNNNVSPFRFLDADSFTIKNIKMIRNTKYVYYEIQKNSNEIYYGIIDIELNTIIFNTNENLSQFKPYQSNGMFAFTNNTVYKVCAYKNGNNCLDTCSDNYILDTENGNTCGTQNCSNFLLYL